ncbi:MAG: Maf family protein [Spongiibacter marinus]|uniref:Maf family protein n=1 Tax=Spongiibacter marinus TaxID=354246 RepID=UPI003C53675B
MTLILASASPRRADLLGQLGLSAKICPADIDESVRLGELPDDYVLRMAQEKADVIAQRYPAAVVLAADTAIDLDGRILGKPGNRAEAAKMLRALSDRGHRVLTAIAVSQGGVQHAELVATEVFFGPLSNRDINDYLASGEADDKAGSYAIQGRAAQFVQRINGSYSGVVGLPLYQTRKALREVGIEPPTALAE